MPVDPPVRFAINELTFALDEIETHWDSMESLLRAHLELVKSQPTDPRILSGDYTREEIGDETSYIQHEINALVKNRDLIREKHRLLRAEVSKEVEENLPVDPNSLFSCCPGEHTFEEGCLATSPCIDPACPEKQKVCGLCRTRYLVADLKEARDVCAHELCECVCHRRGTLVLHDRACCQECPKCGLRAVIIYKSL